ncbi:MAG: hypothetical protein ABH814_00320 [bacterium]
MNLKIDQLGVCENLTGRTVRFSLLIRPEDQAIFDLRGRVCAVFEVDTTGSRVDKNALSKIAEDIFLQNYFVKHFINNEGGFKEVLRKIEDHFQTLEVKEVSFAAVAVLKDYLYMARKGSCSLVFYRSNTLFDIKGITADTGKLQFSSGMALEGDVLGLTAGHLERDDSFKDFLTRLQALDPVKNVAVFLYFEEESRVMPPVSKWQSKLDIWLQARSKAIYVKSNGQKIKKSLWWKITLIFLMGLFLAGTVFTVYKSRQDKRSALVSQVLGENTARLEEAQDLAGLNNQKARDILTQVSANLTEAQKLAGKDQKAQIDIIFQKMEALFDRVNNVTRLGDSELFYDLGLKETGVLGRFVCDLASGLAVVDNSNRLWWLKLSDDVLKVDSLVEKSYPALQKMVCSEEAVYLASGDFVDQVSLSEDKVELLENILGEKEGFKGYADFSEYMDNLYFLKPSSNQIVKFVLGKDGFGEAVNYLDDDQSVSSGMGLVVDGDVYVGGRESVSKYTSGRQVDWELLNALSSDRELAKIYTNSSLSNLYILNRVVGEIWIFNKEGYYQGLVRLNNNETIDDFAVGNGFLTVLSGSKLYRVAL